MSYQVLARKWRPRSFEEMVGQPHVLRALVNALEAGRLHHAYLFTGTRGVGKTTIARIFAKCLNCETGVTARPCGSCAACREIDEGRFIDLIEVDAASRTRVEDTRDLLENVQYAPTRGRYKVYLIDEVHMLSGHSFNALLKTLEEPPPHIQFLLATTDPQKLPVTVLSRCLQFNLKVMPPDMIAGHLARVLEGEEIPFEQPALDLVARAAHGSMRDALSLLDQAIAYGGGAVNDGDVREMLGVVSRDHVLRLLEALAASDGPALLNIAGSLAEGAGDCGEALAETMSVLQGIAVIQIVPGAATSFAEDATVRDRIEALAARLSPEDVQLWYQIALTGRRDLDLAPDLQTAFEMLLLRMLAFRPASSLPPPIPPRERGGDTGVCSLNDGAAPTSSEGGVAPTSSGGGAAFLSSASGGSTASLPPACGGDRGGEGAQWETIVRALGLKAAAAQLANHCSLKLQEPGRIVLTLSAQHQGLRTPNAEQRLMKALEGCLGAPLRVEIEIGSPGAETPAQAGERRVADRQREAEASIAADPAIRELCETFGGQIVPGSVRPAGVE